MFDVITIGSATVDAFAQTQRRYIKRGSYTYPVGSKILLDSLDFHTGGGGTNTAVSFSRLGLKTAYIGKLGKGHNAQWILDELADENVDSSLVSREKARTAFSIVLDAKGHDRTILAYRGSSSDLKPSDIRFSRIKAKWIYSSSLVGKSFNTLKKIASYAKRKGINFAFNPSSYIAKLGKKKLKAFLGATSILVLNKEEAELLTRKKGVDACLKDLKLSISKKQLSKGLPSIVVITDGKKGAYAYDGQNKYFGRGLDIKAVETTGAGDAFASSFVAGIIKGKSIEYSMKLGIVNSQSVIRHYGAKNILLRWSKVSKQVKRYPKIRIKQI